MEKVINYLWIEKQDAIYTIGITEAFQEEAGSVAYVNIAKLGNIEEDDSLVNVEASKATIEIPSPLSGKIIERNEAAEQEPTLLDASDRAVNWLVKLTEVDEAQFMAL